MNQVPRNKGDDGTEIAEYLKLFYPFHYRVGFTVENALRGRQLSQHQAVILWIVHSEGEQGLAMRRKDIEQRIGTWFDITSSAISKALRSLARAGQPLINIAEDPSSGREKRVTLTAEGQREVRRMIARAEAVIATIVAELSPGEVQSGLTFLRRVSEIVANLDGD
jgi:DNA-binding MarR family transcriptional regulator